MKIETDPQDVVTIAQRVSEILKPLILRSEKGKGNDNQDQIFDLKGLAEYLQVTPSWVYKQVSLKTIPYFKVGKYLRFRRKEIDKWVETKTVRPVPALRLGNKTGVTCADSVS